MSGQLVIDTLQNLGLILIGVALFLQAKDRHR